MSDIFAAKLLTELAGLFVVATIMESALSTIFEWRLYKEFFNGRAVKTLVMIGFGFAVVSAFNYDVFQRVISLAGGSGGDGPLSRILSALVLAGGSAAVYQLFITLGLRPPSEPAALLPQPAESRAWFSVRIVTDQNPIDVAFNYVRIKTPTDEDLTAPAIAGVLRPPAPFLKHLERIFFADRTRFPAYGGITVEAGDVVYRITVTYVRAPKTPPITELVYQGRFANRAIVDFVQILSPA